MRVVFMGTGEIGVPTLCSLIARPNCKVAAVVTQPDRRAGRGQQLRAPEIKHVALTAAIPVLQPQKLRDPAAVSELRAFAPDVIVVMAYGQILSREVLDLPRIACLNLHASLLPRHRGAAPIQAAIASGDTQTGITVMYMAEGLDTGDILLTRTLPIQPSETGGSLHDRLALLAPEVLAEALDLLTKGVAPRIRQDEALATYAGRLYREDGRIQWTHSAIEIHRHIRAMNPWPAAFVEIPLAENGYTRLKIFASKIETAENPTIPGTLLKADADGLLIATSHGALRLTDVQGEGTRRMSAGDWVRGHSAIIGATCK